MMHVLYAAECKYSDTDSFLVQGDVRLSEGCEGSLEIYHRSRFVDVCDESFGVNEVEVLCRQLGCNPMGARRTTAR